MLTFISLLCIPVWGMVKVGTG